MIIGRVIKTVTISICILLFSCHSENSDIQLNESAFEYINCEDETLSTGERKNDLILGDWKYVNFITNDLRWKLDSVQKFSFSLIDGWKFVERKDKIINNYKGKIGEDKVQVIYWAQRNTASTSMLDVIEGSLLTLKTQHDSVRITKSTKTKSHLYREIELISEENRVTNLFDLTFESEGYLFSVGYYIVTENLQPHRRLFLEHVTNIQVNGINVLPIEIAIVLIPSEICGFRQLQ